MSDLMERLLAAIDAHEADAVDLHRDGCAALVEQYPLDRQPCTCGVPAAVRRRCAADRVTVELCQHAQGMGAQAPAMLGRLVVHNLADGYGVTDNVAPAEPADRISPITCTKNGPGDWTVECSLCGWHSSAAMSRGEADEDGAKHMAQKHSAGGGERVVEASCG